MRGLLLAISTLILVTLAGCSKEGDPVATAELVPTVIDVPQWAIGHYWSYTTTSSSGTKSMQLAVTGEQGGDWILDTNDATMAHYDALLDVSYVGKISKSNLAGAQGSDRVKFFDFPLELNKTWTTKWDGKTQTITVKTITADNRVQLMAHDDVGMTAEYEYSWSAGFFENIKFYDANGTEMFSMERAEHGVNYTGDALRYRLLENIVYDVTPLSTHQATTSFGDATEIRLLLHAFCNGDTAGQILMGLGPKDEDEAVHLPPIPTVMEPDYGMSHDCSTSQVMVDDVGVIQVEAGESWNIDAATLAQNGQALIVIQPRVLETLVGPFA